MSSPPNIYKYHSSSSLSSQSSFSLKTSNKWIAGDEAENRYATVDGVDEASATVLQPRRHRSEPSAEANELFACRTPTPG
ncbi:unnamed protein product [Arabis nemorensis]|nr:unnamed protein product [Arabis nemorensis]